MAQASPERSRQGSPNGMEDNRSRQSLGGGGNCGSGRNNHSQSDSEEVLRTLQNAITSRH